MKDLKTAGETACQLACARIFSQLLNSTLSNFRRKVERILVNHGYTKTTICTPEELA